MDFKSKAQSLIDDKGMKFSIGEMLALADVEPSKVYADTARIYSHRSGGKTMMRWVGNRWLLI